MNRLILNKLKDSSRYFIDIISCLIRADVEIVDTDLNCLSKKVISDKNDNQNNTGIVIIYKECIKSGQNLIIDNPRKNPICANCSDKFRCLKKLEIGFPILFKTEVIAVISISCYDINEKEKILRGLESYFHIINRTIDLMCLSFTGDDLDEESDESDERLPENEVRFNNIPTLKEMETYWILKALEKYGCTTEGKRQAAQALNIGIATLYRKLAEIQE